MFAPGGKKPTLSQIMFKKFDTDKSGAIDAGEFQGLCFGLGYALSPSEVAMAVKTLDTDGSGQIDEKEFVDWWKKDNRWESLQLDEKGLQIRRDAAETFNEVDSGKTGVVSTSDFDKLYNILKTKGLTTKSKDDALADLDTSGDHKIQFSEYIDWLERIGTIKIKVMPIAPEDLPKLHPKPKTAGDETKAPAKMVVPTKVALKSTPAKATSPNPTSPSGQGTFAFSLKKTGAKLS